MARKTKRRNERRPRAVGDPVVNPGVVAARAGRLDDAPGDVAGGRGDDDLLDAPDPIEHAAPDVELAEAQLAVGRPEVAEEPSEEELAAEALDAGGVGGGGRRTGRGGRYGAPGGGGRAAREPGPESETAVALRPGGRLVHFLQGSWRELQRVQWPDRRQVAQATGVVIGFVIVAGVFLGVADLVASKIVTAILK